LVLKTNPKFQIAVIISGVMGQPQTKLLDVEFLCGDNNRQDFRIVDPNDPIIVIRQKRGYRYLWSFTIMSNRTFDIYRAEAIAKPAYAAIELFIQQCTN
jgi:hypothetical protein